LIPYSINAPAWSDGASKEWLLALPGDSKIEFEAIEFPQPAPGAHMGWKFPDGAVVVETISLDTVPHPRKIETRILHNERLTGTEEVGDQYWRGYTYVWNDEQTDATLLEDTQGRDRIFTLRDPGVTNGQRQLNWHFPSRAECTVCHNMAAKYLLGVTTMQLNKQHHYGSVSENQLRAFERIGLFTKPLPSDPDKLPKLVNCFDAQQPIDQRARSYLHANCSYCHRKWGGGNAEFQLLASLSLSDMKAVGTHPGQGSFFIPDAQVVAPGDPYRSIVYYRMSKLGPGRMPRSGSVEVDQRGVRLLHDWIAQLPPDRATTSAERIGDSSAIKVLCDENSTATQQQHAVDELLASTISASFLLHLVDSGKLPTSAASEAVARAARHTDAHIRDLFERFLPDAQRPKRLGNAVKAEQLLALSGDAARGKKLFFEAAGVACRNCHRIQGQGGEVGPDLSEIAKKYDRAKLLESMLEPSKDIEPKYQAYAIATKRGQVFSGVLQERSAQAIVLRDAQDKLIRLDASEVDQVAPQQQSIMPELLLRDMTAQQVADLIEYLNTLK
jgi:putative heme-binding domain-containing protein